MDNLTHTKSVEYALIVQAISSILQFIADIVIEVLVIENYLPDSDFRMSYTLLAFLAAFTSFKTLDAIRQDEFGLVHEDIQITLITELSLIGADFWFIYGLEKFNYLYIRLPFIILTCINVSILIWITTKHKLWSLLYRGKVTLPRMEVV